MCLGVPGKVVHWLEREPPFSRAEIEFDGIRRECNMACVPEANEGDYVIVHAGVAISKVNAVEAARIFAELAKLQEDDGWRSESATERPS